MSSRRWHAERKRNILCFFVLLYDIYIMWYIQEKEGGLNDAITAFIYILADCNERTQENVRIERVKDTAWKINGGVAQRLSQMWPRICVDIYRYDSVEHGIQWKLPVFGERSGSGHISIPLDDVLIIDCYSLLINSYKGQMIISPFT
jgi:hypothetical protein